MKKVTLIKNSELFQGKKYLNKNKYYFEGWYFKNTTKKESIAFIPGISITKNYKRAFIQIITNKTSYYINYDIEDFSFSSNPFFIRIKENFFSKDKIHIDINDPTQNLKVFGEINYSNNKNISTDTLNPNIMGPFSYIPSMECNHAILSMKSTANGMIQINKQKIKFKNDNGYIEKDWGYSFPKHYIWCQGNNFKNKNTSFMLSIADVPFKFFQIKGLICSLIINNTEYRFATYNKTKIIKCDINKESINIILKKGKYHLSIQSINNNTSKLSAPAQGKMIRDIYESITSTINIILKENNKIIFSDTSTNCGLEIA